MQRRKKRKRDKAVELPEDGQEPAPAAAAQDAQGDDIMASDLLAPLQVRQTPCTPSQHAQQAGSDAGQASKSLHAVAALKAEVESFDMPWSTWHTL